MRRRGVSSSAKGADRGDMGDTQGDTHGDIDVGDTSGEINNHQEINHSHRSRTKKGTRGRRNGRTEIGRAHV